ncbi:MAG: peptide-methionine (R)-S-oxide reductase MsrB [Balneolaceae bacterium]
MKLITIISAITVLTILLFLVFTPKTETVQDSHNHQNEVVGMKASQTDTLPEGEFPFKKSDAEWKEILTSKQYRILREGGTEFPFTNELNNNKREGIYFCAGCGQELYSSEHKYDSGSGWPSFWKPIADSLVGEREDNSYFMTRTEIVCSNCGGHLGHVFDDGPQPTGLRYCMNSAAMKFVEKSDLAARDKNSL